jgi:hypothetical protein
VLDHLAGSSTHRIESLVHFYPAFGVELLERGETLTENCNRSRPTLAKPVLDPILFT